MRLPLKQLFAAVLPLTGLLLTAPLATTAQAAHDPRWYRHHDPYAYRYHRHHHWHWHRYGSPDPYYYRWGTPERYGYYRPDPYWYGYRRYYYSD